MAVGRFPAARLRRVRMNPWSRAMVRENSLSPSDLVWPVFVKEGSGAPEAIPSLPGVVRHTLGSLGAAVQEAAALGIPMIALFPVTPSDLKDERGSEALNPDNLMCRAISVVKDAAPHVGIMADVALDPYTSHGHDGVLAAHPRPCPGGDTTIVDNDASVDLLTQQALLFARAGADVVAPSDMQDGRIGSIRSALEGEGHPNTMIMSYAAKYATYQQDPANVKEALREVAQDVEEGADMVMVKPGLPYLDVTAAVAGAFPGVPLFAYHVSGEYAMVKAAGERGWLDADACMEEVLLGFKRAGADGVVTYAAVDVARSLAER
ncbi:hemB [Symbiodinium sp. KB8]|nr:hemB [Symbiodinium sp. KB8]